MINALEVIRQARIDASREWDPYAKYFADLAPHVERTKNARRWLAALKSCPLCHGTAVRLEPVPSDPVFVTDDWKVKVTRLIGDTLYTGWVDYDPCDYEPKTREVICDHGLEKEA